MSADGKTTFWADRKRRRTFHDQAVTVMPLCCCSMVRCLKLQTKKYCKKFCTAIDVTFPSTHRNVLLAAFRVQLTQLLIE